MSTGNPDIGKHAHKGGKKLLEMYGKNYFSELGKRGRKKQLEKLADNT